MDSQLSAFGCGNIPTPQGVGAVGHDGAEPILHLRQRQQSDVHQVVTIQVRIEDEVRGIAHMSNHGTHVGDEMKMTGGELRWFRWASLEPFPFLLERLDPTMLAFPFGQTLRSKLERGA